MLGREKDQHFNVLERKKERRLKTKRETKVSVGDAADQKFSAIEKQVFHKNVFLRGQHCGLEG